MNSYNYKYDLDDFIENDELNTQIYGILLALQDGAPDRYRLQRDLVHMFNKMYEMCHVIRQEKHPEMHAPDYWGKIRSEHLSYETSIIFSGVYLILSLRPETSTNLSICLSRLKSKINLTYFELFEPILNSGKAFADGKSLPPDFAFLKSEADKIEDLSKRELYYQEYQTRYKQAQNQGDILKQIEDEIKLIERTKALTVQDNNEIPFEKSDIKRTLKVSTDVMVLILQKAGISIASDDKAKIARLIGYLTDFSEEKIRQRLSNSDELTSYHKEEVENTNKILKELNTNISITYNKNR